MSVIISSINDSKMPVSQKVTRRSKTVAYGSNVQVVNDVLGKKEAVSSLISVLKKVAEKKEPADLAHYFANMVPSSFLKNKFFHSACKLAENNASVLEASSVLVLATTLRPATIMVVPGPSPDDRKYAAAKSIATGVVSFILTAAMYLPLAKHLERLGGKPVEKLSKAAVKALQDPKFPKFGSKAYESFTYLVNYGSKLIVAPLDALALFTMIPIIINQVFPHKKKNQNNNNYIPSANLNLDKEKKDLFKDFIPATAKSAGDVKSKITEEVKQPKKGLSSGMKQALGWSAVAVAAILGRGAYITKKAGGNFLNNCTKETILSSIYNSAPVQKIVKWSLKELPNAPGKTNLSLIKKHLPAALGVWISGFYIQNTINSKGIPEERKMPLVINTAFSGVVGTLMGYTITGAVEKFADALTKRFDDILASNPEKEILKKGFKSIVPLVSFTFAFRYLCPVLATPVADLINKYLIKHKMIKDPNEKQKEETKS